MRQTLRMAAIAPSAKRGFDKESKRLESPGPIVGCELVVRGRCIGCVCELCEGCKLCVCGVWVV